MTFEVLFYESADQFLYELQVPLEQDEVSHGVILGVCMRMARFPERYAESPCLVAVHDGKDFVLAGMITPPYNLVLAAPADDVLLDAYRRLAHAFEERDWLPPGVLAPIPLATAFAGEWSGRRSLSTVVTMRQRLFELKEVIVPARPAPGRLRKADIEDLELIAEWVYAFGMDAFGQEEHSRARTIAKLRLEDGDIYLWEHRRQVVSMAGRTRPTRNGVSISLVYTPPSERGQGYASHCVAALSQLQLDAGFGYCSLFTDLSNPTSNHIYQEIGYRPVRDFCEIRFLPRP